VPPADPLSASGVESLHAVVDGVCFSIDLMIFGVNTFPFSLK
jgi:hypothetical protein